MDVKTSDASILRPVKRSFFFFFLSLHHPNIRFENILLFYLPLFNSVAKCIKNIKGTFAPIAPPSYAYAYK
jgi:hypothetical protein